MSHICYTLLLYTYMLLFSILYTYMSWYFIHVLHIMHICHSGAVPAHEAEVCVYTCTSYFCDYTRAREHALTHTHTYTHTNTHKHTNTHTHTHTHTHCIYTYTYVRTWAHNACIHTYNINMYTHTHTHSLSLTHTQGNHIYVERRRDDLPDERDAQSDREKSPLVGISHICVISLPEP